MAESTVTLSTEDLATIVAQAVAKALAGGLVQQAPQPKAAAKRSTTPKAAPKAAPKAKPTAKPNTKASAKQVSTAEPSHRVIQREFILEAGYRLSDADPEGLAFCQSTLGMARLPKGELPTMGHIIRAVQSHNVALRDADQRTYFATFRVLGSKTRLSSHQVRFIIRNGSLRGYKAPKR